MLILGILIPIFITVFAFLIRDVLNPEYCFLDKSNNEIIARMSVFSSSRRLLRGGGGGGGGRNLNVCEKSPVRYSYERT